jgi:hypothetical protein
MKQNKKADRRKTKVAAHKPAPEVANRLETWCRENRSYVVAALLGISILLRVVYFLQLSDTHLINQHLDPESDMQVFDQWAVAIGQGDLLTKSYVQPEHGWMKMMSDKYFELNPQKYETMKRALGADTINNSPSKMLWRHWYGERAFPHEPLYAYFVALVYKAFGHTTTPVFILQMILGVLINFLVYLVTRRYFGDLAGVIAAFMIVFAGPLMFYEMVLLRSTMAVLAGILVVCLLGLAMERDKPGWWILAGAATGLAVLVHAYFILFVLVWIVFLAFHFRKKYRNMLVSMLAYTAGVVLSLSPVMVRNVALDVPVMSMSNNSAVGFITMNNALFKSFQGWMIDLGGATAIMAETDGSLMKSILPTLATHPDFLSILDMVWNKFHATFSWYEISNNVNFYFYREQAPVLFFTFISFLVISPLALVGLFLSAWKKNNPWPLWLMILVYMVPMLAFMVLSRYRIIFVAVLVPFAAFTVRELLVSLKSRQTLFILAGLTATGFLAATPAPSGYILTPVDDYQKILVLNYSSDVNKAITAKEWQTVADLMQEFFARYEPERIRSLKPFYKCTLPGEANLFKWFSDLHANIAGLYQFMGKQEEAQKETALAEKLKSASGL